MYLIDKLIIFYCFCKRQKSNYKNCFIILILLVFYLKKSDLFIYIVNFEGNKKNIIQFGNEENSFSKLWLINFLNILYDLLEFY